MFRPALPAIAALIFGFSFVPALGQTLRPAPAPQAPPACATTQGADNCVRFLACFGDQGRWIDGRAIGRGTGTLSGIANDGVTCEGEWTSRNFWGVGQADVACSDGMEVTVLYFYQEEYTGTATGSGTSNRGEKIQAWSGNRVPEFLNKTTGKPELPCGEASIPIS